MLLAALSLTALALGGGGLDDSLFGGVARRWLERNGELARSGPWEARLERNFARLSLGAFEVYIPGSTFSDAKALSAVASALQALHSAEEGWKTWVSGGTPASLKKGRKGDLVHAWLGGWSPKTFAKIEVVHTDLAKGPDVPSEVRAELERLQSDARRGQSLGVERAIEGVRLAIFPHRGEFVELTCVVGAEEARLRASAWSEGLTTWLEYQAGDTRFLALEHAESDQGDLSGRGISVGARNPLALGELVTQVGIRALLDKAYVSRLDPALASAMANALVIDLYEELDTRIDGDVRARSSQGTSMFVPGGNSEGGTLPATSAENRWRGSKGRDHFVGVLAQVQKQSAKKSSTRAQKLAGFELQSDSGSEKALVFGPFLGAGAQKPSPALFPDYLELVRSYGIAFLHWLRTSSAESKEASQARFASFLNALGRNGARAEDLGMVLQEIYGQPLSAGSPEALYEEPTLEGRFLSWLSKQG